jgi:hypothetical protein
MSLTSKIVWIVLSLVPLWGSAAESVGLVTIVDGDGFVLRNTQKIQPKPGFKLLARDMLVTGPQSTLLRLELNKGGVFDLGPSSLSIVHPGLQSANGNSASLYLLKGWLKVSAATNLGDKASAVLSERMEVLDVPGSTVIAVQTKGCQVFAETGTVSVANRHHGKSASPAVVPAGAIYTNNQGEKIEIQSRVHSAFIQSVPKGLQETIPALANNLRGRAMPVVKALGDLSYQDANPWLAAEPIVRNLMVTLWTGQLPDDLRKGLVANIGFHPEWRSVLFPAKELIRNNSAPSSLPN